jgi:hypothetical protein
MFQIIYKLCANSQQSVGYSPPFSPLEKLIMYSLHLAVCLKKWKKALKNSSVPTVGLIFMLDQKKAMMFIETVLAFFTCLPLDNNQISVNMLALVPINRLIRENNQTGGKIACC